MVLGANSSRPTGSFRQRPKPQTARKAGSFAASRQRKQAKVLTDADHYLKLKEPCVASLRSDRHEIGMTDRHHRNTHRFPDEKGIETLPHHSGPSSGCCYRPDRFPDEKGIETRSFFTWD